MTKNELLNIESSLMERKTLYMGDKLYSLSKDDIITLYHELSGSIQDYIGENTFYNEDRTNREMEKLLKNFFKNLNEYSFSSCFDDDEIEE